MVLIDTEGIVAHINEIASLILGVDLQDALGSPFDDLSSNHPHYLRVRDALRTLQRAGPEGQRTEIELHVRGRDHSYVLKSVPLHHTVGKSLGTLLILQDVTYIRDQDRARTNLVATLSHELRTPLTSLALSAELLSREIPGSNPRSSELLAGDPRRMLADASAYRQPAQPRARRDTRDRRPAKSVSISPGSAADVTRRFAIQAREKHVEIQEHIESVPAVIGDPVKLLWVISNLLGNALRDTPAGGTIKVSTHGARQATRLEVTDSGPGIPPELKDYIFERFAQYGSDGLAKGLAGLGLLASSRKLSRPMAAGFSSRAPTSRLPIHRRNSRRAGDLMAKLLIVDDERNIRRSLVSFFESLGHEVRAAENGTQAVAILAETRFDLVLTDYRMAEMSGLELLREISGAHPSAW